jgi:hypothetical protein
MHIDFSCSDDFDLFYLSRVITGLYALPGTTVRMQRVAWVTKSLSAAVEVDGLKLAIDVGDHSDQWDPDLLEWGDVYAKRNVNPLHISPLQRKIIPFGLSLPFHSRRGILAALAAVLPTLPRASKARLREVYRYLATPHWKAFEHSPEQPVDPMILYQARVWDPQDAPADELINEQRTGLLRTLRREFGKRVVGGVVPGAFARRYCPDLITDQPCRHPQYVRWAKKPLIGIYFRGLFHSIAFKMAEFLAASKCIVSEPIHNVLTEPLGTSPSTAPTTSAWPPVSAISLIRCWPANTAGNPGNTTCARSSLRRIWPVFLSEPASMPGLFKSPPEDLLCTTPPALLV